MAETAKPLLHNIIQEYDSLIEREFILSQLNAVFPDYAVKLESELKMNSHSLNNYLKGTETISVRYAPGKIRIPKKPMVGLIHTLKNGTNIPLFDMAIPKFVIKPFKYITEKEAFADGGQTPNELFKELKDIYEPIYNVKMSKNDVVTLWHFK